MSPTSTGVPLTSTMSATFSNGLAASTVDATSFTLTDVMAGALTPAAVTVVGTGTAVLTPTSPLQLLTNYQARLANTVKDSFGQSFAGANWSFTTRDGIWDTASSAQIVSDTSATAATINPRFQQLGIDAAGDVLVAFNASEGTTNINGWSARLPANSDTWSPPIRITPQSEVVINSALAVNPAGKALTLWGNDRQEIWAMQNDAAAAGSWTNMRQVNTVTTGTVDINPKVAINDAGNGVAVWTHIVNPGLSTETRINFASVFNAATGTWGTQTPIETDTTANSGSAKVAIDKDGNAFAAWYKGNDFMINSMPAGGGWGSPAKLNTDLANGGACGPQLVLTAQGNGAVAWCQDAPVPSGTLKRQSIFAMPISAGSLGALQEIRTDTSSSLAVNPSLAVDPAGNVVAVWSRQDNAVGVNRLVAGGSWGSSVQIDISAAAGASSTFPPSPTPKVAVDSRGNAIAVFDLASALSSTARRDLWFTRYNAAAGTWSMAQLAETDDSGTVDPPQIAFDSKGQAVLAWRHPLQAIKVNRFR